MLGMRTIAQQNLPQATLALREYSEIDTFWSMIPSAKLSSLQRERKEFERARSTKGKRGFFFGGGCSTSHLVKTCVFRNRPCACTRCFGSEEVRKEKDVPSGHGPDKDCYAVRLGQGGQELGEANRWDVTREGELDGVGGEMIRDWVLDSLVKSRREKREGREEIRRSKWRC